MKLYDSQIESGKLDLILFDQAVDNVRKINRALNMDKGNALLIGVAGSGKRSLAKLAAFTSDFIIQVSRLNPLLKYFLLLGTNIPITLDYV